MALPDFIPDEEADRFFNQAAPSVSQSSAPDFIPDADAESFFSGVKPKKQPAERSGFRKVYDAAGSILQGLTFGAGDEITAGAGSLLGMGYDDTLKRDRADTKQFETEHPGQALAYELLGGLATAPVIPGATAKTIGGAIKAGALSGAATGFGKGEGGVGNRLADALAYGQQGAVLGGALGTAGKAVGGGLKKLGRVGDDLADSYRLDALGVKKSDIVKGLRKGETFIDDAGNPVALDDASGVIGRVERDLQTLKDEGFFKGLGMSDPQKISLKLEQRTRDAGGRIGGLETEAQDAINNFQKQSGVTLRMRPKWDYAEEIIDKVEPANPSRAASLRRELESVKDQWSQSGQSLEDLIQFRRSAGEQPRVFAGTQSADENEMSRLKRAIYRGFQQPAEENFNAVMKNVDPSKVGALKEANRSYGAYKTFEDPVRNAVSKGGAADRFIASSRQLGNLPFALAGYQFGNLVPIAGMLGRNVANTFPIAAASGVDALASALTGSGKATQAAGSLLPALLARPDVMGESEQPQISLPEAEAQIPQEIASAEQPRWARQEIKPELVPLLKAMMGVESSNVPTAVSNKGAAGLMQIMPYMQKAYGVTDPFDPEQSIKGGAAIISDELDRFGDLALALAAYNAGSPAVTRAIKKAGSRDFDQVARYLPDETQKYVPKILARL